MVSLRGLYLSDELWNAFTQFHIEHELRLFRISRGSVYLPGSGHSKNRYM